MKTLSLPLTALVLVSLAACGGPESIPPSETAENGGGGSMLDNVGMDADDSYTPAEAGDDDGSMRLAGELAEGSWSSGGAGLEFGREGFQPVASFGCAAEGGAILVSVPQAPADADDEDAEGGDDAAADDADTAEAGDGVPGSVITSGGVVTGTFMAGDGAVPTWDMTVPADDPAFAELAEGDRIGVAVENQETRLMEMSGDLVDQLQSCTG